MPIVFAHILQPLIDAAEAVIVFLHDDLSFGWGLGIVGLTFITRVLILPLSIKQISSMRHLQQHAPELKLIQEKYKNDRERQQRELMKFYRENKINPLASCWPLLLQLPVFFALYELLRSDSFQEDVYADPPVGWLFVNDLTEKATGIEVVVLVALFIGTQVAATLVMSARIQDRNQKIIMYGLPVFIAPFIITLPAGLAVYWISTNVWTLGQQWVVHTFWPPPEPPKVEEIQAAKAPPPPPRKRKRRR
jgi:YidC/Oxa1 family membrane protein insertase